MKKIDVEKYFAEKIDQRNIKEKFNFEILDRLRDIFTDTEEETLAELNEIYRHKIENIVPDALRKEIERLTLISVGSLPNWKEILTVYWKLNS